MNLATLQEKHRKWSLRNFGAPDDTSAVYSVLGIQEELGELCHELLKEHQGIRRFDLLGRTHQDRVRDAVGDIVMFLLSFCNDYDVDFMTCVKEAWKEIKNRDWKQYPENGITA